MGLILRWFHCDGRRYHAFIRLNGSAADAARELVICCTASRMALPIEAGVSLDEFSDAELRAHARALRHGAGVAPAEAAGDE